MPDEGRKAYAVVVSANAYRMLEEHARFLAQVSEDAARKLKDDFIAKAKTLETMPERYAWLDIGTSPPNKYRKLAFGNYYVLIYLIEGDCVFIDAVVDARRDNAWLL